MVILIDITMTEEEQHGRDNPIENITLDRTHLKDKIKLISSHIRSQKLEVKVREPLKKQGSSRITYNINILCHKRKRLIEACNMQCVHHIGRSQSACIKELRV